MAMQQGGDLTGPEGQEQHMPGISSGGAQVSFAFPAVEEAYKPSGRVGPGAALLMVVFGLLAAVVLGVVQALVYAWLIGDPLELLRSGIYAPLGAIVLPFIMDLVVGALLGGAVWLGARAGKSTNFRLARAVAIVSGIVSVLVSLGVMLLLLRSVDKGVGWWVLFVALAVVLFLVPVIAGIVGSGAVETSSFCETCERFMKSRELAILPVSVEGELLHALNGRAMPQVARIVSGAGKPDETKKGDWLKVNMSYCQQCRQRGFLDVTTNLKKREWDGKAWRNKGEEKRLVFSSDLNASEIAALANVRAGSAGAPGLAPEQTSSTAAGSSPGSQ